MMMFGKPTLTVTVTCPSFPTRYVVTVLKGEGPTYGVYTESRSPNDLSFVLFGMLACHTKKKDSKGYKGNGLPIYLQDKYIYIQILDNLGTL